MKRCVPILMLAMLAAAQTCLAQIDGTINMTMFQTTSGNVDISTPHTPDLTNTNLDPYQYTFGSAGTGVGVGLENQTITGLCLDLTASIAQGSLPQPNGVTYDLENLQVAASNTYNKIEQLMAYAQAGATAGSYTGSVSFSSSSGPAASPATAGLGIAIWAVLEETNGTGGAPSGGYSTTLSGSFVAGPVNTGGQSAINYSTTAVNYAKALLTELNNNDPYTPLSDDGLTVEALVPANGSSSPQSQILVLPDGFYGLPPFVPEPRALVGLVGLALCGLPIGVVSLLRRRRLAFASGRCLASARLGNGLVSGNTG